MKEIHERRSPTSSNELILLIRIRHPRRAHPTILLRLILPRRASDRLALSVEHVVLVLDELDGLALLELLDGFGERDVENLAALRRAVRGVVRVRDIRIGGRGGRVVGEVGRGRVGRGFVARVAFEHGLFAREAGVVDGAAEAELEAGRGLDGTAVVDG